MKTYTTENEKTGLGDDIREVINLRIDDIKEKDMVSTAFIHKILASKDEFKKYFDIEDDEIVGWDCEIMDDYDYTKMISDIKASYITFVQTSVKNYYDKMSDFELYRMFVKGCGIHYLTYDEVIHTKFDFDNAFYSWEKYLKENFNPEKYIINENDFEEDEDFEIY